MGVPSEGKIFNSDEDAYEFYFSFAYKSGFSIIRHNVYKCSKSDNEESPLCFYRREFICHHTTMLNNAKLLSWKDKRTKKLQDVIVVQEY